MRSEFESQFDEWWEENYMNVSADRTEAFDIYSLGLQHQQSKVDELQNNINLLTEALDIKEQLNQKLREREDELQKQLIDQGQRFNEQAQRVKDLEHKNNELQKQVDAALQLVNETKGKRYPFSAYADQLEQALKGGGE